MQKSHRSMGFKLRLIVSVLLFIGFVYCDRNNIAIYKYPTQEIFDLLAVTMLK